MTTGLQEGAKKGSLGVEKPIGIYAKQYTYNQNQRLIQVVDGTMTAGYTYNGNGQRVKKTVNGVTTIFHYSLSGQIIAESTGAGATTAEYVYLNGQPLAKIEGANTYYFHNDHLGTPQKMTNSAGAVVWSAEYKPFGEATITGTVTNNLRFPGQYYDAETGTHYNYYRDYNPQVGRYIEADPLGLEGGINLFAYTDNNPIVRTDPKGLFWPIDCIKCFYYMNECAKKGLKCKDDLCKRSDLPPTSSELFNECYKGIPECRKQIEYCGKCALTAKGSPGRGGP